MQETLGRHEQRLVKDEYLVWRRPVEVGPHVEVSTRRVPVNTSKLCPPYNVSVAGWRAA